MWVFFDDESPPPPPHSQRRKHATTAAAATGALDPLAAAAAASSCVSAPLGASACPAAAAPGRLFLHWRRDAIAAASAPPAPAAVSTLLAEAAQTTAAPAGAVATAGRSLSSALASLSPRARPPSPSRSSAAAAPSSPLPVPTASSSNAPCSPLPPLSPALDAATAAAARRVRVESPEPEATATAATAVWPQSHGSLAASFAAASPPPTAAISSVAAAAAAPAVAVAPPAAVSPPLPPAVDAAPTEPPAGFQLGFSSGSGKPVQISSAAMRAAQARMKRQEAEEASTPPSPPAAAPAAAEPPAGFQLGFSSGHGARVPISDAAVRAAANKMGYVGDEAAMDTEAASSADPPPVDAAPPAGFQLGFSSGRGARVQISDIALRAAQAKMKRLEAEEANMADGAAAVAAAAGPAADAAAPSAASTRRFAPSNADQPPADFELGFSTGKGRRVAISSSALRAAEAKMREAEASVDAEMQGPREDETTTTPQQQRPFRAPQRQQPSVRAAPPSSSAAAASAAASSDSMDWDAFPAVNSSTAMPPPGFELGFSTGKGSRVAISAQALKQAEAKMRDVVDATTAAPSAQEPFSQQSRGAAGAATAAAAAGAGSFHTGAAPFKRPGSFSGPSRRNNVAPALPLPLHADESDQKGEEDGARPLFTGSSLFDKDVDMGATASDGPPAGAASTEAEPPAGFQLGFSSGRGARVQISSAAMRAAAAKMKQIEAEEATAVGNELSAVAAQPAAVAAAAASRAPVTPPSAGQRQQQQVFSAEALALAKAFMEQEDSPPRLASASVHLPATTPVHAAPSAASTSAPHASLLATAPLSSERIKAAAALMDEFDDAAQEQPIANAVEAGALVPDASTEAGDTVPAAALDSATLLSPGAAGGPAVKRRKSNFSNALPMPVDEEADDALSSDTPPQQQALLHTPQQPPRHQPQPHQQAAVTPLQAARPPNIPLSAGPPSALASRKRRGTAFVSPRVANKPVLALTTLQQQPSLLGVSRTPSNNGGTPKQQAANGAAQQLAMHFPALGGIIPPPVSVPASEKVSLREFSARCQAKLEALGSGLFASQAHASCTDIPVDCITSVNAAQVLFVPPGAADGDGGMVPPPVARLGWLDVRAALLAQGLDSKVCSIGWVRNQYRWVVWKLASYDKRFGAVLPAPACTFARVVQQCRARFERECNLVQQPALRKILEGDEAPGKYLVLLVAQIIKPSGAGAPPAPVDDSGVIPPRPPGCDVELSDGWYSVWVQLDAHLQAQVVQDKIRVGQKLRIWGAQLGGETPTTPLENRNTHLKIHINGTRRARWDAKLGVQKRCAFLVNFASLRPDGGPAPAIRVAVCKQYPMVYLHPPDALDAVAPPPQSQQQPAQGPGQGQGQAGGGDASAPRVRKLHCNQRAHEKRMAAFEKLCETRLENLRRSFEQQHPQRRAPLTADEQQAEEEEWAMQRAKLESTFADDRKQVVPYLKLHMCELTSRPPADGTVAVAAAAPSDSSLCWSGNCCLFTVWRPFDDHLELLQPGKELIIYGFSVHARYKGRSGQEQAHSDPVDPSAPPHATCIAPSCNYLQLSTSRHTNIVPRALAKQGSSTSAAGIAPPTAHIPLRSDFFRKPIYMRPGELWSMPRLGEFDLVCVVLYVFEEDEQPQLVGGGALASVRLFRRRRLLVAGLSGDMLLVDVNESKEHMYFPSGLLFPAVMLFENLQYSRYEKKLFLHTAQATAITTFKVKGALRLANTEHGSFATPSPSPSPTPTPALTHALYAHPCLGLFQAWASSAPAAMLFDTILQLVRRMIHGAWCGDQASSFNKDEFATMLSCPVTGHIMPLTTPAATTCNISSSLTLMLLPPAATEAEAPAPAPDAAGTDKQHVEAPAAAGASPSLVKKRTGSSLLAAGSHKPPSGAAQLAAIPLGDEAPIAADCVTGQEGLCYHPSHTLSLLLDAAHWSVQLCLDDNAAGRWPLQLDSHAFRRVLSLADSSDDGVGAHRLRESWLDLLRTGDVPFASLVPVDGAEEVLLAAMLQLRRHVFQQLALKFQLDEAHQAQHVADFIMLVLSHSAVLPAEKCLEATSTFLAGVSPPWAATLKPMTASSAAAVAPAAGVSDPASSSPPPLVSTHIVCSLSQPDQVCVEVQCSQLGAEPAAAASEAQPMDTSDSGAPARQDGAGAAASEEDVILSCAQLSQLHQLLSQLHASEPTPSALTVPSPPLFFFTRVEWSALCEELFSVLSVASCSFQLAECERHVAPTANGLAHHAKRTTPQPFRSVFIPHPEHISRK